MLARVLHWGAFLGCCFGGVGDSVGAYGWQGARAGAVWGVVVVTSS